MMGRGAGVNKHQKRNYLTIPEETEKGVRKIPSSLKSHGGSGEGQGDQAQVLKVSQVKPASLNANPNAIKQHQSPQEKETFPYSLSRLQNIGIKCQQL